MAAPIDFAYLHRIASGRESHATLTRIESDRERLLSDEAPRGTRRTAQPVAYPGTRGARTGPVAGKHTARTTTSLTLRSDLAPASIDTFLEIVRDHAHAVYSGFRGETGGTVASTNMLVFPRPWIDPNPIHSGNYEIPRI